jgi:hypothetical protein
LKRSSEKVGAEVHAEDEGGSCEIASFVGIFDRGFDIGSDMSMKPKYCRGSSSSERELGRILESDRLRFEVAVP